MTSKKKIETRSSTESSSASTSDSTSSTSSSSASDSSSSSDSDSSASEEVTKPTPQAEIKKSNNVQKSPRKSTDNSKSFPSKTAEKPKPKPVPSKPVKTSKSAYTSEDEDVPKKDSNSKVAPKRTKPIPKPKTTATVLPKPTPKPAKPPEKTISKSPVKPQPTKSKAIVKSVANKINASKKKSIFSPENSSESDDAGNRSKLNAMKAQIKNSNQKPRTKAAPRTVPERKRVEKPKPAPPPPAKTKIISSASSETSSTASSTSSDSETSSNSSASNKTNKRTIKKTNSGSKISKDTNSESDGEKVTRKLTRSSSTRKSKHLFGKNVYSDTDSDTESTKRSLSRSPVKRAPVATKGKTKNSKRNDVKSRPNEIAIISERKCPIEGCNSQGHLGGRQEKHFTIEACPLFHNTTTAQCKEQYQERKKREDFRRKAMETYKKSPRNPTTAEQKNYLQKVKELRAKFKQEALDDIKPITDKNKEPNLNNVVPDYDLKLFRDAQAVASEKIEEDLKALPNTKATKFIEMGKFEMEVWYQSPYPDDYARLPKLYICEYCLRYMKSRTVLQRHVVKCVWRHPPGEEVYRKDKISVWEVDGKRYKQYCQNLCLLAKFFLDHKTLYYDVEPFLFYVMTMSDNEGCHTVGYFSKEKNSFLNYNVSCILTLPPYQRQGYGRLLIDFSYLLTRVEGKIGSPEKPLSDLGLISYRSYWKDVLLGYLCSRPGTTLSVKDISQEMAIHSYDIVSTLQALGMMKYWKGKHIILKKQDVLDEYVERVNRRGSLLKEVDPSCLRWKPFVPPQPAPV